MGNRDKSERLISAVVNEENLSFLKWLSLGVRRFVKTIINNLNKKQKITTGNQQVNPQLNK